MIQTEVIGNFVDYILGITWIKYTKVRYGAIFEETRLLLFLLLFSDVYELTVHPKL